MAWIAQAVGGALGTVGTITSNLSGDKLRRALQNAKGTDPTYTESPYAADKLALAKQLINSRMPGAAVQERNIAQSQANTLANVNRNATDASQALALAAATQGQTNAAVNNLGQQEAQDYYNRLGFLSNAQDAMSQEHMNKYQDTVRKWQDLINIDVMKHGIRQQQGQNLANLGAMIGSMNFGGGGASGGGGGK